MTQKNSTYSDIVQRVRWDLNPRSPAPKADTLIRARLRTRILRYTSMMVLD
jgi:hypothetical protein